MYKGKYFNSRFENSMSGSFGKVERKIFEGKVSTRIGPGSYDIKSEFGSNR
jgi:hypothetical protein